jgi:prepilin-type N-terminal cleavage/methylation domain-containing protein
MTRRQGNDTAPTVDRRGDEGFSLVELMVAIGVFSVLMVMVGAATLTGFRAIREASSRSQIQQESQNAMEWVSRLLRYSEVPDGLTTAVPEATANAVTVYTYSGTGTKDDVPYKARVASEQSPDGSAVLVSDVWTPTRVADGWTWNEAPRRRTLLTIPAGTEGAAISLTYYACTPTEDCSATRHEVPASEAGPLVLGSLEVPESIVVSIGDPGLPGSLVTQHIGLVNLP